MAAYPIVIAGCIGALAACALPAWGQGIDVYSGIAVGQGGPQGVMVGASDLINGNHVISSGDVNMRTVKWRGRARKRDPIAGRFVSELLRRGGSVVLGSDQKRFDHHAAVRDVDVVCDAAPAQRVRTTLFI